MEETRFMQEFPIMLPEDPDVLGRLKRASLKGKNGKIVYEEVYEWKEKSDEVTYGGAAGSTERNSINKVVGRGIHNHLSRQDTIFEDTLYLCDCGGHNHYLLLNSLSFTRKSIFMVVFKATDYHSHGESYHQLIGCHIETIIGKDPEACILLVGSWWDEVEESSVLKSKEGVHDLFVTAAEHINDRMKHISETERPKLITCPETKIFPLSNKAESSQNGLTRWQSELSKVFHSILTHEDILPIQSNIPRFWESFNEEMKKKFETCIEYHQARACFNNMV